MQLRTAPCSRHAVVRAGFTLMELLVVVAILLVLSGAAASIYMGYLDKSKKDLAYSKACILAQDLRIWATASSGEYPPEGDWSLVPLKPEDNPPLDAWSMPFRWALREVPGLGLDPVVWSSGPNRMDENGAGDDISSLQKPF